VIRDLAVMLADGGDCLADLGAVRDQEALFGSVASDSTAFRLIDQIACTPGLLDALATAHARAREHVWKQTVAPGRVTIDIDATLIASHSEKEGAAGTFKGGYGFHPLMAYCDETGEALAAICGPATRARTPRPTRSWLSNSKVRLLSHRSFGFHGPAPLIALIYLCCSRLTISPPLR
jgi:hypothetical protein